MTAHELFVERGYPTIVLEWCSQGTLAARAKLHPWPDVIARAIEAGRGLAYLHARGAVHGDVKPTNVLIDHDTGKIADFGLAQPDTPIE